MADAKPKLTKDEAVAVLNAVIRNKARYKLEYSGDAAYTADVVKMARKIYDDIMADLTWESSAAILLTAIRGVDGGFSRGYVERVVQAAIDDGTLVAMDVAADAMKVGEAMRSEGGMSEAKAPKLGSGGRFKALKAKLAKKGVDDPGALAAFIGRKKYGKKKFAALSK